MLKIACVAVGFFLAVVNQAEATSNFVSYVSNSGSDTNNCSLTTVSCASFQKAYDNTAAFGVIVCLSSGSFGVLTAINKSITIDCHPFNASVGGGWGIAVGTGEKVVLRGLTFNNFGLTDPSDMIGIVGGGSVSLVGVSVTNGSSSTNGLRLNSSVNIRLLIQDSTFSDLGNGVLIKPSGGTATVTIERTTFANCTTGLSMDGSGAPIKGMFIDSLSAGNNVGIETFSTGNNVTLTIDNSRVVDNTTIGLEANGPNEGMIVGRSTINNNGRGLFPTAGGVIYSYGNNEVNGNPVSDGSFTATIGLH